MLQAECACLYKTVNLVVFYVQNNVNTYPKGRALRGCTGLSVKRKVVISHRYVALGKWHIGMLHWSRGISICCIEHVTYVSKIKRQRDD